jgi:hypothetical protein
MKRGELLIMVSASLAIAGCPTRSKYDPLPVVRITSPAADQTYTNGTVHFTAALDPPLDLPIVLRLDGNVPLATLLSPTDTFDWNTASATEGPHFIVAEVMFSDATATSIAKTVIVDRTAPRVIARTPAPGAVEVALRGPIEVEFSEPIVLPSPQDAAFALSDGSTAVASHAGVKAGGATATISIADPMSILPPVTLSATIAASIKDRAGNDLVPPPGDWTWSVPDFVKLPPSAIDANMPASTRLPVFGLRSDSTPLLAGAAGVTAGGRDSWQVVLDEYDGSAWKRIAPPSDDIDSASRGVAMAMSGDQPFVAWRPSVPDPGELDVSSWNGTAWQPSPRLVPAPGVLYPTVAPVIRVGQDQRPVVLWSTGDRGDRYFMARRTDTGWNESFGTLPLTTLQPFDGLHFDMIMGDSGQPIVSWIDPRTLGHVSTWNGSNWTAAPDTEGMTEPWMALDSSRTPMVVLGSLGTFLVQHLAAGNSWQLLPPIMVPPTATHPRIAAGPAGLPVVAYFNSQWSDIGIARWTGQRWDTRAYAFGPSTAVEQVPQLVVDPYENAWVGWRDSTGQFNVWLVNL